MCSIHEKVSGTKNELFRQLWEKGEGDRNERSDEWGVFLWINEEHSSFRGDVVSCRGVVFGIRGVQPRLKMIVQSHGMR